MFCSLLMLISLMEWSDQVRMRRLEVIHNTNKVCETLDIRIVVVQSVSQSLPATCVFLPYPL